MEHDNNFCRGCHIFIPAGQPFVRPDTGTYLLVNQLEGKHDTLECHQCHLPDKIAQAQELVLWMVDRPDKVPPHAKVPPGVCKSCHEQGDAKKTWQEIATTAGHRVHFESDSLKDRKIECLTCHARSAHRFVPVDSTCAQQGCHLTDDVTIKLGKMADQTGMHCAVCHEFTAAVPRLATFDSASGTLVPGRQSVLQLPRDEAALAGLRPDPRPAQRQVRDVPQPAYQREAGRRAQELCVRRLSRRLAEGGVPYGRGAPKGDGQLRNLPYAARCTRGRQRLRSLPRTGARVGDRQGGRAESLRCPSTPPRRSGRCRRCQTRSAPTERVTRRRMTTLRRRWSLRPRRTASSTRGTRSWPASPVTRTSSPTSTLNFTAPRGCQICHHTAAAKRDCAACHASTDLAPAAVRVTVTVPKHAPRAARSHLSAQRPHRPGLRGVPHHAGVAGPDAGGEGLRLVP